jgi:hypothetical protein
LLSKTTSTWAAAAGGSQSAASLELASGKSVIGIGGWSGSDNAPTLAQFKQYVAEGKIAYYIPGGQGGGRVSQGGTPPSGKAGGHGGTRPGRSTTGTPQNQGTGATTPQDGAPAAGGGKGGEDQANSALTALLSNTTSTWAAATDGSQSAASLELASGKSVIGIGGWSGSDNAPTLAQFKQYVAEGKIAYYISGGHGGGRGGFTNSASEIQAWVTANYTATTVGNSTVYSLNS